MSRFINDVRGWLLVLFSFLFLDLDECKDKTHQCDVNANCTNIPGSYNCTYRPGYTGNGRFCEGKNLGRPWITMTSTGAGVNLIKLLLV